MEEEKINEQLAEAFIQWANAHYDEQRRRLQAYAFSQRYQWDEDIFANTLLSCYERIKRGGIKNKTEDGFAKYLFLAFRNNTIRETSYARTKKRSFIDNLELQYERFSNNEKESEERKLLRDLKADFYAAYLCSKLEDEESIDALDIYCFKLKYLLENITYKKLQQLTQRKDARTRVLRCKEWLQKNVQKKEVDAAFENFLETINIFTNE